MNIKNAGSGHQVKVNAVGQLATDGAGLLRDSAEIGRSYCWRCADADINAGDTVLIVQNQSDDPLSIDKIIIQGSNVASNYKIHKVDVPFTFTGGSNVVAVNMNTATGKIGAPPAQGHTDEEANAHVAGNILYEPRVAITTTYELDTPGLILGNGIAIAIDQVTESTSGRAAIYGHYLS